nr:MAG TPA: hypothetical protein [Caudoviricetes sp.]
MQDSFPVELQASRKEYVRDKNYHVNPLFLMA